MLRYRTRPNEFSLQPSGVWVSVHALSYSSVYVLMAQMKCSEQLFHTDCRWINYIRIILWHLWRASWKNKEYGSSFSVCVYFKRLMNTKWMHLRKIYIYIYIWWKVCWVRGCEKKQNETLHDMKVRLAMRVCWSKTTQSQELSCYQSCSLWLWLSFYEKYCRVGIMKSWI